MVDWLLAIWLSIPVACISAILVGVIIESLMARDWKHGFKGLRHLLSKK